MTCGIEDAGFEIRDCIMWLYGSGFPKSLNIGKAVDKLQGNERVVIGKEKGAGTTGDNQVGNQTFVAKNQYEDGTYDITKGTSEWKGWGTALKPAVEPIVVARKPLSEKNVALNVLKWGTGGINIDACRINNGEIIKVSGDKKHLQKWKEQDGRTEKDKDKIINTPYEHNLGRFPANIILDEEAGKMLDEQSGILGSNSLAIRKTFNTRGTGNVYTTTNDNIGNIVSIPGKGGASRFFYCAKASKSERNFGLDGFEEKKWDFGTMGTQTEKAIRKRGRNPENQTKTRKNNHPTVKPIKLMEYLIKLITPKGGKVLDPFGGSGTTGIACAKNGYDFILIEKEPDYIKIAEARIKPYLIQRKLL
jgi:site-specific DNA-methyltransferase (adenine-specific)